jgi:hypothetical protein
MSRFKILAANPRRSLAALATVLVAVGVTGASGANFNAASANPTNVFTAGTLTMANSKANAAILTAANMRPGDPATKGTVDIKNTGSLSAPFTLSKGTLVDAVSVGLMSTKLNLVVTDCGTDLDCAAGVNDVKYTGTVAGMGTGLALSPFAANEERRYEFAVALDSSADDTYQAGTSTVQFLWNATS